MCCLQEPSDLGIQKKRGYTDIPCKWKFKKVAVAILISDKIDLKRNTVTRDK